MSPDAPLWSPSADACAPVSSDNGSWGKHHLGSLSGVAAGGDLLNAVPGPAAPRVAHAGPPRPRPILGTSVEFSDPVLLPPVTLPLGGPAPPHVQSEGRAEAGPRRIYIFLINTIYPRSHCSFDPQIKRSQTIRGTGAQDPLTQGVTVGERPPRSPVTPTRAGLQPPTGDATAHRGLARGGEGPAPSKSDLCQCASEGAR